MSDSAQEVAFRKYKETEATAIAIMKQLREKNVKEADIEIALLAAIFEMHKGKTHPQTVAKIIAGHTKNITSFYSVPTSGNN